jgi:hypothetical protein
MRASSVRVILIPKYSDTHPTIRTAIHTGISDRIAAIVPGSTVTLNKV